MRNKRSAALATAIACVALLLPGCTHYSDLQPPRAPLDQISLDELRIRMQGLSNKRIHTASAYANATSDEKREYYSGRLCTIDDLLRRYHAEHDRRVRLGLID